MTGTLTGVSATFSGTLGVTGATTLGSTLGVTGASTLAALSATTGTFSSTLGVTGATTLAALSATTGTFSSTLAVTGAATFTSTAAINSTSAAAIDVAGGITAGSGNVAIIGTDGRIPAISSTTFASLSGANLTGIPETAITDGTLLARVASTENITGAWTFGSASATGIVNLNTPTATNAGLTYAVNGVSTGQLVHGSGGVFHDGPGTLEWRTVAGASRATLTSAGLFTAVGGLTSSGPQTFTAVISPAALTNGNNNDYAPSGLATTFVLRATSGGGSTALTGLSAQAAGFLGKICAVGFVDILAENAGSTAANRFASAKTLVNGCTDIWYDTASSRWRIDQ